MSYILGVNDFSLVEGGRWKAGGTAGQLRPTRNEQPVTRHGRVVLAVGWMLFGSWVGGVAAQETGWKADLARMKFEVPIDEVSQGEIVGQKWIVGGARPGFLGAKAFFLVAAPPEKVAPFILNLDPTEGKDMSWEQSGTVKAFQKFARPPGSETWNRFRARLEKMPFETLLSVAGQKEGRYHLSAEEIQKISQEKISGWIAVLEGKFQTYSRGGWKELPAVPAGPGVTVDFDASLREVLKENGPVRDEFRRVLTALAYGGRDEKEKIEVNDYWQLMEVDKSPAISLGCGVMRQGVGGRWEVADMQYWASNGYYGAISLYGIWPYQDGKSLVCRIDAVETDPEQLAQATARMIGESLFMREVKAACELIKKQISANQ